MAAAARSNVSTTARAAAISGARDIVPLTLPAIPFGLVVGLAIYESDRIGDVVGWSSSWIMFAGSAQLSAITLLAAGAPAVTAIAAAIVINLRHLMYSAALVPRFRGQPRWFKLLGSYLLIDQIFVKTVAAPDEDATHWRSYYLGAGALMWIVWQVAVAAGILVAPILPHSLDLEFIAPALFLCLLVPGLTERPAVIGVIVAAVVTTSLASLPNRGGMLVGSVAGVVAATLTDRAIRSATRDPRSSTAAEGSSR